MGSASFRKSLRSWGANVIAVWSLFVLVLASGTIYYHHLDTLQAAECEARDYFRLNQSYRSWAAGLGGFYAPVDKVAPNPYLNSPRRDITSSDGQRLTLINPAYMTRMVFEVLKSSSHNQVVSKITSLKPLNPANAPDPWERNALAAFDRGEGSERAEITTLHNQPYLRLITRFLTDEPCLSCHAVQGYRLGDVRGGITISIPLSGYYTVESKTRSHLLTGYLLLWLVGSSGIAAASRRRCAIEDELRAGEEKFRTVCDWTQDWEYWIDQHGRLKYNSPSCHELTGYAEEDFRLDPQLISGMVHPDDRERFLEHQKSAASAQRPASHSGPDRVASPGQAAPRSSESIEFRIVTRDGAVRWMHHACRPVYSGGHFLGARVSNRDITERKLNENKLRVIFDVIQAGIIELDASGVVTFANQRMAQMLGMDPAELLGSSYLSHVSPAEVRESELTLRKLLDRELDFAELERRYLRKDGSEFWGYLSVRQLGASDDNYPVLVGTISDLTELKSAEEKRHKSEQQMLHVQKLESLGVLAGGIAHDFNNILLAIMGNASLALHRLPDDSPIKQHLLQIEKAAEKAADLARQMLAYSGKGRFVLQALDLNRLIREMAGMLEVTISKKVRLRFHLARELPAIVADPTQIRQIVMNLAINASEAIGEASGVISFATGCRECSLEYLGETWLNDELSPGRYVFLEVADTGCGMEPATVERIFEPFFTTKFTGRGLGMAAILGIVRGHRGAIKVYTDPGIGSSFKVYFPASEQVADADEVCGVDHGWSGKGTVLLVDDEETVRAVGAEMLRELGFEVLTAVDGRQALQLYGERGEEITLVLMDLNMPQLNGEEAFHELRKMDPLVRVILSSGFSEQEVTRKFLGQGLAGFVQKPYTLDILRESLRRLD